MESISYELNSHFKSVQELSSYQAYGKFFTNLNEIRSSIFHTYKTTTTTSTQGMTPSNAFHCVETFKTRYAKEDSRTY